MENNRALTVPIPIETILEIKDKDSKANKVVAMSVGKNGGFDLEITKGSDFKMLKTGLDFEGVLYHLEKIFGNDIESLKSLQRWLDRYVVPWKDYSSNPSIGNRLVDKIIKWTKEKKVKWYLGHFSPKEIYKCYIEDTEDPVHINFYPKKGVLSIWNKEGKIKVFSDRFSELDKTIMDHIITESIKELRNTNSNPKFLSYIQNLFS